MQAPHARNAPAHGARALAGPHAAFALRPTDHELTVLIPAFNEHSRLGPTLDSLGAFLETTELDYRVVVCDDGSTDDTARYSEGRGHRFSTLALGRNQGKGAAVRAGMLSATGAVVAFTDADLPYDLRALIDGYTRICQRHCEAVFGARDMAGAASQAPRRLSRRIATAVFSRVVSTLISRRVTDTQCGLKLFSRRAAHTIFSQTTIDGFAFDAEVVFMTRKLGIPFERVPVTLINEYSSTLSLSRHALPMLADVMRVRYRHRGLKPDPSSGETGKRVEATSRKVA
ncbi:MAG TPA: glycosyltransferase [Pirellulales bacterium]|jgi:dolichyl-phosphate beta-glucosyltransferase|nr:glycosyltransferase [Pirellulales bacterium]